MSNPDLLVRKLSPVGYYYFPLSTGAKTFFNGGRYLSISYPGWYGFLTETPNEHEERLSRWKLTAEWQGSDNEPPKTSAADPDGPPRPLPVRIPHRYELLGFVPNKFGFHG